MRRGYLVDNPDEGHVTILDMGTLELKDLRHDEITRAIIANEYHFHNVLFNISSNTRYRYFLNTKVMRLYSSNKTSVSFSFDTGNILSDYGKVLLISEDRKTYLMMLSKTEFILYFSGYLYEYTMDNIDVLHDIYGIPTMFNNITSLGIKGNFFKLECVYSVNSFKRVIKFNKSGEIYYGNKKLGIFGKKLSMKDLQRRLILGV